MLHFQLKDFIDVVLVAILMFGCYRVMRKRDGINLFLGIIGFIIVWLLVTYVFRMELLGNILDKVMDVGAILLVILFQEDIRIFMARVGKEHRSQTAKIIHFFTGQKGLKTRTYVKDLVQAVRLLAQTKTGALIVIQRNYELSNFWQTGDRLDARINARLIENIFYKNTPLHDGAMIIVGDEIRAAGCILPVSRKQDIPKSLGLRHRAAIGMSERTDALIIVVSEETGKISYTESGNIHLRVTPEELEYKLNHLN